jgi:hypothetical protein
MGGSAHTTHHTNPEKKSAPPLFLEDKTGGTAVELVPSWPIFEKILIFEKMGGC